MFYLLLNTYNGEATRHDTKEEALRQVKEAIEEDNTSGLDGGEFELFKAEELPLNIELRTVAAVEVFVKSN